MKVGDRVLMCGDHCWAGYSGVVVRFEVVHLFPELGPRPVIKLDSGQETFAMDDSEVQVQYMTRSRRPLR